MKNNRLKLVRINLFFLVYMGIGAILLGFIPEGLDMMNYSNYLILVSGYFVIVGLLFFMYIRKGLDILEPIVFISIIYLMLFTITPIINYWIDDNLWFGIDLMSGCIKATSIFIISYLSFYLGYYKKNNGNYIHNIKVKSDLSKRDKQLIYIVSLFTWIICFICSLIYLFSIGMNLRYIFSFGTGGYVVNNTSNETLGFLNMFSYSLIPTWMYIYIYGRNRIIKFILAIMTLNIYFLNGFRFIIVIFMLAPIIYSYLLKNKRPKLWSLILVGILLVLMVGLMGYIRSAVRFGSEINWNNFDFEFIVEALKGNFDIYKSFYGGVINIPKHHSFTYGQQFLYTFTMFIPRFFWENKPFPVLDNLLSVSISDYASKAGTAWPNLGEFYTEFGIIGCIIIMFILGIVCGNLKKLYQNSKRSNKSLIIYSLILPAMMQLIIRGYTPSNFYLIIFLLLPVLYIPYLVRKIK